MKKVIVIKSNKVLFYSSDISLGFFLFYKKRRIMTVMTTHLGTVESTLFVPMLGRIYASEHFPSILHDTTALTLKSQLPAEVLTNHTQTQYTYLASAVRSANIDRHIQDFLSRNPDGAIVQLGCGLETTFNRNDNGRTRWYGVDLPEVIKYRKTLLPESHREKLLATDAFSKQWLRQVREEVGDVPLLITASGLFYYFEQKQVLDLLRMLGTYGVIEVVFDAVNQRGLRLMRRKWMKQVGHADAQMYFCVDSAKELASNIANNVQVLADEPFYRHIDKKGLKLSTKFNMIMSDRLRMVKMIHLQYR